MKGIVDLCVVRPALVLVLLAFWSGALLGRSPDSYQITPDKSTMLIGEQRSFRMVDQNGHAQTKVTWTISNVDAFESIQGDELRVVARQAGEYRLTARTDFATAEGTITVVEGSTLAPGTVRWSSGAVKGCTTVKVIPAIPRGGGGPDFFAQSMCEDGQYVTAYTADGVQLWRTRIGASGTPPSSPGGNDYEIIGNRLEPKAASVCDAISAGTEQAKIRELLEQRKVAFHEEPGGAHVWLVEESNAQCRLWFDEKGLLVKKKKVFVTE